MRGTGSWLKDVCVKGHELAGSDHILELATPHGPLWGPSSNHPLWGW